MCNLCLFSCHLCHDLAAIVTGSVTVLGLITRPYFCMFKLDDQPVPLVPIYPFFGGDGGGYFSQIIQQTNRDFKNP